MSQVAPGEALFVPRLIEPENALAIGEVVSSACVEASGLRMDLPIFYRGSGLEQDVKRQAIHLPDDVTHELERLHEKFESLYGLGKPNESYLMATYMSSDSRAFSWHVDPDFDIRTVINISNFVTSVKISHGEARFDRGSPFLDSEPSDEEVAEIKLEPGDAYLIDNRTDMKKRLKHRTPSNQAGRTMLRFNHLYPPNIINQLDLSELKDTQLYSSRSSQKRKAA